MRVRKPRTAIQKAIIPRNWLFGRLAGIKNNLRNLISNKGNFNQVEMENLSKAQQLIDAVIRNKSAGSKLIKVNIELDINIQKYINNTDERKSN